MANPWIGLELGTDPIQLARTIAGVRQRVLSGDAGPTDVVRRVVRSSWERSQQAGVDPDHHDVPSMFDAREAGARWAQHPLKPYEGLVDALLGDFADASRHLVAVSDADGTLLRATGHRDMLAAAERIGFEPGFRWDEAATGTNGVGTALALDHPVQIFSAEHYNRRIQGWTCSGAPIHDPATGAVLGALDLSTGIRAAHPSALALVSAAAAAIEAQLGGALERRRAGWRAAFYERVARSGHPPAALLDAQGRVLAAHPGTWLSGTLVPMGGGRWCAPGTGEVLDTEPLGDGALVGLMAGERAERPLLELPLLAGQPVRLNGVPLRLSPRRVELLSLLARHPEGLTAEQVAVALFGDAASRTAARAEVSRLRRDLGGVVAANPYRLLADVTGT